MEFQRYQQQNNEAKEENFTLSEKDRKIFVYQFVLNLLAQPTINDKMAYFQTLFVRTQKFGELLSRDLKQVL